MKKIKDPILASKGSKVLTIAACTNGRWRKSSYEVSPDFTDADAAAEIARRADRSPMTAGYDYEIVQA